MFFRVWIGRYCQTDVYLHWTWILFVLAFCSFSLHLAGFVVLAFLCVLLHELGHCLMAQWCGIKAHSIHLFPLGGVAMVELTPDPKTEILVAIAGPLVNLVLAPLCYVASIFLDSGPLGLFTWLALCNATMFGFNLLPIFPMDGGRILRAFCAMLLGDYVSATFWTVRLGQVLAGIMVLASLWFCLPACFLTAGLLIAGAELEWRRVSCEF